MILVGDIGGTYTRLALFEKEKLLFERKYFSRQYASLEKIIEEFRETKKVDVVKACFGVAGPVRNGVCKATNLPWTIDTNVLIKALKIPFVKLLNDLEAKAYGIDSLKAEDLVCIQKGKALEHGNRALIAAGTGLGEAGLIWDGKKYLPFACEGGHVDFAAKNEEEFALFSYLRKKMEHVSVERVVSGPGIYQIFQFLVDTGRAKLSDKMKMEMEKKDPSKIISEWAMKKEDPACVRAFDLFLSLYGGEAGNLALKFLSLNGVYIAGGMATSILEKLKSDLFLSSFSNKGRFESLLKEIPIYVVMNDDIALYGASSYTKEMQ